MQVHRQRPQDLKDHAGAFQSAKRVAGVKTNADVCTADPLDDPGQLLYSEAIVVLNGQTHPSVFEFWNDFPERTHYLVLGWMVVDGINDNAEYGRSQAFCQLQISVKMVETNPARSDLNADVQLRGTLFEGIEFYGGELVEGQVVRHLHQANA